MQYPRPRKTRMPRRPAYQPARRHLALAGPAWLLLPRWAHGNEGRPPAPCARWPLWEAYLAHFVQADGRVIDDQHATRYTTSEGQAYTLFFALVANDRDRFDTLLQWTERHLAGGDLHDRLPGWRWGRHDDGRWTLIDANSAADADLWLAHTLFEAARLWKQPRYGGLAYALLSRVKEQEIVTLPGLGPMLLPAPLGFVLGPGLWRLNPSYLALHQLRAFQRIDPSGPWQALADNTLTLLRGACTRGYAPDWVNYSAARGWHAGRDSPPLGSYDAVRCYLWAGLLAPRDPLRGALLAVLGGMRRHLEAGEATPPQKVDTDSGLPSGESPPGFSAALLPYLQALGREQLLARQWARVRRASRTEEGAAAPGCADASPAATGLVGRPPTYYDQVLTLFGQGALERRFAFDTEGRLLPAWQAAD
ncbi:cellulose synthase complex periplasmic endoglucanase BcsZ [Eleftheria terrae]|uniref:cellulose synthase complex periplasmic endoglucanase BcsZ n=1 Tax=Eleftheria terrae TaxID=1597781 RepID=UPI00263B2EFC|nr:cellulose synthase complex periplasmic endoglucanase BcsZ [Eleftheria terrae]WKB53336.1 cellulose synthase complex periplasmic endoglucanase BcsZ [Eleftheria terrae]